MLRFILVSTILLAQALAALSKSDQLPFHADSSCEERAKEAGLPTHGWTVVHDDKGQLMCRREVVEEFPDGAEHKHHHNPCYSQPVYGSGKSLGIKYGHCYILSFGDGKQLATVRENTLYSKGGFFHDIPFKVCKATDDCALGKTVEMGESFYLEDQQGRYNDPKGTKGWIDNASGGAHIGFTLNARAAGTFTGIPTCAGGECAIKVLGGPTKSGSAGSTCPVVTPGISFWGNPKMHDPIRFSEVTCDDYEVPPTSGIPQMSIIELH